MKPVNSRSLFTFICDQMEKLDAKEMTVEQAQAQSSLCQQATNILKYELERAKVKIALSEHNVIYESNLELRNAESKKFVENDI